MSIHCQSSKTLKRKTILENLESRICLDGSIQVELVEDLPGLPGRTALVTGDDAVKGTVAAQTATIQAGYVAESGATLVEFATPDETIAAVKAGEADAVLADKAYLDPIAESDGELVMLGQQELIGGGVGLGLRESDGELRAAFDAAITSMKEDGSLNALIAKWGVGEQF